MSAKFPKYAQSISEFTDAVSFYTERVSLVCSRADKVVAMNQLCNYLCNNAHILFGLNKAAATLEKKLIEFLEEDSWLGSHIYLQRLFPMSMALSGRRFLPKPL